MTAFTASSDGSLTMCVYAITHRESGRVYVGQTIGKAAKRWHSHCSAKSGGGRSVIKAAIQKYGRDAFEFSVLDIAESQMQLDHKECFWIAKLNVVAPHGFNIGLGGNGKGKVSDETRRRISEVQRGRKQSQETIEKRRAAALGRKGYWAGKKQPAALIERRAEKLRGKKLNPSQVERLRQLSTGRIVSEETRKKLSDANIGKPSVLRGRKLSAERVEQIRRLKTGVFPGAETRSKMSAAQTGRRHSQVSKDKVAAAKLGVKRSESDVLAIARGKMRGMLVCCETGAKFESFVEAEAATGIDRRVIWNCAKGIQKTAKGLRFWLEAKP